MPLPPGPAQPAIVQSMRMQRDPLAFLRSAADRFGDVFTLSVVTAGKVVATSHPDTFEQIFTDVDGIFVGGEAQEMIEPMVGPRSIFLSDGDDHTWKRRIMFKPFHRTAVQRYAERIGRIADAQIDSWPVGQAIPMRPRTQRIAMEVILQIVFGVEDPARIAEMRGRLERMREPLNLVIMAPPLRRNLGPWSPWTVFQRRRAAVDEMVFDEIARRRKDPVLESRDDILSLLLTARDEDGRGFTDAEVRDQLLSMVFAGYETTAIGLAWTIELLARHPEALERVRAELGAEESSYLDAVIDESLRLYPPLFHVARKVTRPVEIGGHLLPEGTWVMVAIILAHRRPDVYADPDRFRPERFLEGEPPPRYAFVPFAAGARRCLGMHLAKLEMRVVLERLVRRMEIAPGRAEPDTMKLFHITVVPRHGATVVLRSRADVPV
jgi:cytochrome P450 family 135